MSFFFCNRRLRPADTRGTRSTTAGKRKGRRSSTTSTEKKAGRCLSRGVASEEAAAVGVRLETLKALIPSCKRKGSGEAAVAGTDLLFEEAADYIVLLQARVGILQRLLEVYGSGEEGTHASLLCDKERRE